MDKGIWNIGGLILTGKKPEYLVKNMSHCDLVHYRPQMKGPGLVNDHPLYLVCPDVLSLVGELLSAEGLVHRIT